MSERLMIDSMIHWAKYYHVDGFRFDLASTLARQFAEVDRLSAFSTLSTRTRSSRRSS